MVRKSFFASSSAAPTPTEEFNFDCYTHFRVYNEVLINRKVEFPPFRKEFESIVGRRMFDLGLQLENAASLLPAQPPEGLAECLRSALRATDGIGTLIQREGLLTSWERSIPPPEDVEDFAAVPSSTPGGFYVSSDITYSLALNGDVTLGSQLLLQELGYRMYPAFGRWMVQEGIRRCFEAGGEKTSATAQIDDYYMDTSYNSNPDLFEVKQVLLNIVIQRG